jgi:hypothetical protein
MRGIDVVFVRKRSSWHGLWNCKPCPPRSCRDSSTRGKFPFLLLGMALISIECSLMAMQESITIENPLYVAAYR